MTGYRLRERSLMFNRATRSIVALLLLALTTEAGARPASVRSDGTILVDGQPFFPIGFYWARAFVECMDRAGHGKGGKK